MKVAEAIKTASGRVQINCYAPHTYEVLVWSPKHNAWWQGQVQRRERALHDAWEAKVRTALELLDVEDAGAIANSAVRWLECIACITTLPATSSWACSTMGIATSAGVGPK